MNCPACGLPWNLVAGKFPLHTSQGEQCPMSNQTPARWPLPPALYYEPVTIPPNPTPEAIKEPSRKVRRDKGTKRGQRKKGGESHAVQQDTRPGLHAAPGGPPSQEPERVAAKLDPPPRFDAVYYEALKRMNATEGEARHDVRPPTKVEDWHGLRTLSAADADSTGNVKPPAASHEPKEGYLAAGPGWLPLTTTFEEAYRMAGLNCGAEPRYVFHIIPVRKLEGSIKETRLGRVRKAKP